MPGPGGELDEYPDYFEFGNRLFISTDNDQTVVKHMHPTRGKTDLITVVGNRVIVNDSDWEWGKSYLAESLKTITALNTLILFLFICFVIGERWKK